MKKLILLFTAAVAAVNLSAAGDDSEYVEECEFERFYVGGGATLFLPQGGGDAQRLAGATARCGWYFAEFWSLEGEAALLENSAGMGVNLLWHWWGYERLDPFFTFGAKGWFGGDAADVGPKSGFGFFYHLTDSLSLRFDADATLGLDGKQEMRYTLTGGVQWSF